MAYAADLKSAARKGVRVRPPKGPLTVNQSRSLDASSDSTSGGTATVSTSVCSPPDEAVLRASIDRLTFLALTTASDDVIRELVSRRRALCEEPRAMVSPLPRLSPAASVTGRGVWRRSAVNRDFVVVAPGVVAAAQRDRDGCTAPDCRGNASRGSSVAREFSTAQPAGRRLGRAAGREGVRARHAAEGAALFVDANVASTRGTSSEPGRHGRSMRRATREAKGMRCTYAGALAYCPHVQTQGSEENGDCLTHRAPRYNRGRVGRPDKCGLLLRRNRLSSDSQVEAKCQRCLVQDRSVSLADSNRRRPRRSEHVTRPAESRVDGCKGVANLGERGGHPRVCAGMPDEHAEHPPEWAGHPPKWPEHRWK